MHHVTAGNMNFQAIKVAILEKRYSEIEAMLNPMDMIAKQSNGLLRAEGNNVLYKEDVIVESLVKRLLDIISSGHADLTMYIKFMENTYNNPSKNSREELYKFIEHKEMPITEDGCVLGYKGVGPDYKDKYSGKFRNKPGDVNAMPRRGVDDNCNNQCSHGFHVGSKDYADQWAGHDGHLMVVKYDPADAVSVPEDGMFEKLRVSKYQVVCEIPTEQRNDAYLTAPVYSDKDGELLESEGENGELSQEQTYHDDWYKARNYIQSQKDNGYVKVSKSYLDSEFGASQWWSDCWTDLLEAVNAKDTGFDIEFEVEVGVEDEVDLTHLEPSLGDLLDEATSEDNWN
jgi:hypothetical protein